MTEEISSKVETCNELSCSHTLPFGFTAGEIAEIDLGHKPIVENSPQTTRAKDQQCGTDNHGFGKRVGDLSLSCSNSSAGARDNCCAQWTISIPIVL